MIIESINNICEMDYGTKANNVIRMHHEGIVVPRSWVISHSYITSKIEEYLGISLCSMDVDRCIIEDFFTNFPLSLYNDLYLEVIGLINGCEKGTRFAIRSSHLMEDGKNYSFSGLFTTELNLSKAINMVEAILNCWKNCFCEGVQKYFDISNSIKHYVPCAILIQEFIPSEVAGVMFKIGEKYCINSTWGMAKSIVDGSTGFDSWEINNLGEVTNYSNTKDIITVPVFALANPSNQNTFFTLVVKEYLRVGEFNNSQNYIQVELNDTLKNKPSLLRHQIKELLSICDGLSSTLKLSDCDIEWAYCKGKLYVLQCRSITRSLTENIKSVDTFLPLVSGVAYGKCFYVENESDAKSFPEGALLVAKRLSGSVLLAAIKASGCIVESKSPLSHSAIIARELGIPAVGAADLQMIEIGEEYEIDGEKGTITKMEELLMSDKLEQTVRFQYDTNNPNVKTLMRFIQKYK